MATQPLFVVPSWNVLDMYVAGLIAKHMPEATLILEPDTEELKGVPADALVVVVDLFWALRDRNTGKRLEGSALPSQSYFYPREFDILKAWEEFKGPAHHLIQEVLAPYFANDPNRARAIELETALFRKLPEKGVDKTSRMFGIHIFDVLAYSWISEMTFFHRENSEDIAMAYMHLRDLKHDRLSCPRPSISKGRDFFDHIYDIVKRNKKVASIQDPEFHSWINGFAGVGLIDLAVKYIRDKRDVHFKGANYFVYPVGDNRVRIYSIDPWVHPLMPLFVGETVAKDLLADDLRPAEWIEVEKPIDEVVAVLEKLDTETNFVTSW